MKTLLSFMLMAILFVLSASAQDVSITPIRIPDLAEYRTLKCDLHLHTVFSDGDLWPDFRVVEAVAEGLDVIAVTDHIEYLPKKAYLGSDRNISTTLAKAAAERYGLLVIPGAEITRSMPPGHLNAIFVSDANALAKDAWRDAVSEARKQGALIFWNHPGWAGQQPDGVPRWYDEHTELLANGTLWGMEVANHLEFYPQVLAWCREKGLAMLGNSDTHQPTGFEFHRRGIGHRPMTLVFARERTLASVREALEAKRTAVYYRDAIYADAQWLEQIFARSVIITPPAVSVSGQASALAAAANTSELTYHLTRTSSPADVVFPQELTLRPGETALFPVRASSATVSVNGPVTARYRVKELVTPGGQPVEVPLTVTLQITPKQ